MISFCAMLFRGHLLLAAVLAVSALLVPMLSAGSVAHAAQVTAPADIEFTVFRDGEPMGNHVVTFKQVGDELHVDIEIDLKIDFGFVTIFRYTHTSHEVWRDSRLISIVSTTNDDGDHHWVRGEAGESEFRVESSGGNWQAPLDILPTSYWDNRVLGVELLLNTQTGEAMQVKTEAIDHDRTQGAGEAWGLRGYRVSGDIEADVWYDPRDRWSSLIFSVRGSDIAYRPSLSADQPQTARVRPKTRDIGAAPRLANDR